MVDDDDDDDSLTYDWSFCHIEGRQAPSALASIIIDQSLAFVSVTVTQELYGIILYTIFFFEEFAMLYTFVNIESDFALINLQFLQ